MKLPRLPYLSFSRRAERNGWQCLAEKKFWLQKSLEQKYLAAKVPFSSHSNHAFRHLGFHACTKLCINNSLASGGRKSITHHSSESTQFSIRLLSSCCFVSTYFYGSSFNIHQRFRFLSSNDVEVLHIRFLSLGLDLFRSENIVQSCLIGRILR